MLDLMRKTHTLDFEGFVEKARVLKKKMIDNIRRCALSSHKTKNGFSTTTEGPEDYCTLLAKKATKTKNQAPTPQHA